MGPQTRLIWMPRDQWKRALKKHDTVLTVLLFDPFVRIWLPIPLRAGITPNAVTVARLFVALTGAAGFATGRMAVGATAFVAWYLLDCVDGKLARLKQMMSVFGDWLDRITDRLGVGAMAFALAAWLIRDGQAAAGMMVVLMVLTWFLRCMNGDRLGWISEKTAQQQQQQQQQQQTASGPAENDAPGPRPSPGFRQRMRDFSARTRITMGIVHDVEWLTLSLVVAPLTGQFVPCLAIAVAGMATQMLMHVAVFWGRRSDMVSPAPKPKPSTELVQAAA